MLRGKFKTQIVPEEKKGSDYEKKAIESIGGSMVFVERKKVYWDGISGTADTDNPDRSGSS